MIRIWLPLERDWAGAAAARGAAGDGGAYEAAAHAREQPPVVVEGLGNVALVGGDLVGELGQDFRRRQIWTALHHVPPGQAESGRRFAEPGRPSTE